MAETTEQYRNRINQLKTNIENEPYIKEMREDIAEGIYKTGNRQADIEVRQADLESDFAAVQQDARSTTPSGAELAVAAGSYNTLGERLDAEQNKVNAQLAQIENEKASINYVDAILMDIAKGGPKALFNSLATLTSTYPNGAEGTFLVMDSSFTDGAHSFMWDSTNLIWKDLGVYQATGIAKGSVKLPALAKEYDFYRENLIKGKFLSHISNGTVVTGNDSNYGYVSFERPNYGRVKVKYPSSNYNSAYMAFGFLRSDGEFQYFTKSSLISAASIGDYISYDELVGEYIIDFEKLLTRIPNVTTLYFGFFLSDNNYCRAIDIAKMSEFTFLDNDSVANIPDKSIDFEKVTNTFLEDITGETIVLPPKIPVVSGHQLNIYYENILHHQYVDDVSYINHRRLDSKGDNSFVDKWQYRPTNITNLTSQTRYIQLFSHTLKEHKQFPYTLVEVPANAGTGTKKAVLIGDSKINAGIIPSELVKLFNADESMNIELLGTRGTAPNLHEGRPGWSASTYCSLLSSGGSTNAFWNPSTLKFDFNYWMNQQGYSNIDVVCINLGTNDARADNTSAMEYLTQMVNSVHSYDPNIKILVGLTENVYQGRMVNNTNLYTKDVLVGFVKDVIESFGNRETENIYLTPLYVNMDLQRDFNFTEVPESDRNPILVKKCTDTIHQNEYGYLKNADMIYYTIKYAFA